MGPWQIVFIVVTAIGLGIDLERHGEEKKPMKHNFFIALVAAVITHLLLWAGGWYA